MSRRNGGRSGCINWPTHLEDSGEGGVFVYAIAEVVDNFHENDDWFSNCCGVTNAILLPRNETILNHGYLWDEMPEHHCQWQRRDGNTYEQCTQCGEYQPRFSGDLVRECPAYEGMVQRNGPTVLAAVCLGSSRQAWSYLDHSSHRGDLIMQPRDHEDVHWLCTKDDLTASGQKLVRLMEELYEREVKLVTLLDT